jgi:hypothetical protein
MKKIFAFLLFFVSACAWAQQNLKWYEFYQTVEITDGQTQTTTRPILCVLAIDFEQHTVYSDFMSPVPGGFYETGYQFGNDKQTDSWTPYAPFHSVLFGIDLTPGNKLVLNMNDFEASKFTDYPGREISGDNYRLVFTPCGYLSVVSKNEIGYCYYGGCPSRAYNAAGQRVASKDKSCGQKPQHNNEEKKEEERY